MGSEYQPDFTPQVTPVIMNNRLRSLRPSRSANTRYADCQAYFFEQDLRLALSARNPVS